MSGKICEVAVFKNTDELFNHIEYLKIYQRAISRMEAQYLLERSIGLTKKIVAIKVDLNLPDYKNKYVITGGPGFGKSTIIEELRRRGYYVYPEVARAIIREQAHSKKPILPWINRVEFDKFVLERMVTDYHRTRHNVWAFFDRGFPDLIGWRKYDGIGYQNVLKSVYEYP